MFTRFAGDVTQKLRVGKNNMQVAVIINRKNNVTIEWE
jgi:hypothetical protein